MGAAAGAGAALCLVSAGPARARGSPPIRCVYIGAGRGYHTMGCGSTTLPCNANVASRGPLYIHEGGNAPQSTAGGSGGGGVFTRRGTSGVRGQKSPGRQVCTNERYSATLQTTGYIIITLYNAELAACLLGPVVVPRADTALRLRRRTLRLVLTCRKYIYERDL